MLKDPCSDESKVFAGSLKSENKKGGKKKVLEVGRKLAHCKLANGEKAVLLKRTLRGRRKNCWRVRPTGEERKFGNCQGKISGITKGEMKMGGEGGVELKGGEFQCHVNALREMMLVGGGRRWGEGNPGGN